MTTMVQTQERPKRSLLIIFAVFVLPVVLAKLALDGNWFERGATNRGELLQPVVSLTSMLDQQAPSWRVMYVVPATCNAECENALYAIQQVWIALGKLAAGKELLALARSAQAGMTKIVKES